MSRRRTSSPYRDRAGIAGLEQRVLDRYRQLGHVAHGSILVAFSGGPDSLALAGVLSRIGPWLGRDLVAVHVDHGIRSASRAEANQAATLATRLGLLFRSERISSDMLIRHAGVGLEEAARRERYLALARVADSADASLVAVGHHREDQAETILLHLLRGSGLSGAAGMVELVERRVPWWPDASAIERPLRIWRPLLDEPRSELRAYVTSLDLVPVDDDSNADLSFRRNAVRLRALPCLEAVVPDAAAALARFGRLAAEDDAFLDQLATLTLAQTIDNGGLRLSGLRCQPVAMQRRVIRQWLTSSAGPVEVTAERIDAVRRLALSERGDRQIEVGRHRTVRTRRGRLVLEEATNGEPASRNLE